jgi:hypothetical protein
MDRKLNKYLYKIQLYILRIIPMLLAICHLFHTVLSHLGVNTIFLVYLGKVSFLTLGFLYVSSYAFHFCGFHRIFLHYILTVNVLNLIETYTGISNDFMLGTYIVIPIIFLVIILIKYKNGCNKENCIQDAPTNCGQN